MRGKLHWVGAGALCALSTVGCGGGGGAKAHELPWEAPRTQVIAPDRSTSNYTAPEGDDCIVVDVAGDVDTCVKPQDSCPDGQSADVVLGTDGQVVQVICYPPGNVLSVEEIQSKDGKIKQNENKSVIALDDIDDGVDLMGDLEIDANDVVIYGQGPELSVVQGDVKVDGNNIIVHGVRIQGDVHVKANNAYFVACVIEGDLVVDKNNTIVSACDVLGNIVVKDGSHNSELTANRVTGNIEDEGKNTRCVDNHRAADVDMDGTIDASEVGDAIDCGGGKPGKK